MDVKKVLLISQEIDPYTTGSPTASFSRTLAQGLQEKGAEVRSFMPRYGAINERRNQLHEVIRLSGLNIPIDDTDHPLIIKVATLQPSRLQVYFIDNDDYFMRHMPLKQLETVEYAGNNDERAIFFVHGVIETVKKLRWTPDLIICAGWISGLVPMYLKSVYADDPAFEGSKIAFVIVDDPTEGALDARMALKLHDEGLSDELIKAAALDDNTFTYRRLNEIGMDFSDAVLVSSPAVDSVLADYAHASQKPVLDADAASDSEAVINFFKSL